MNDTELDALLAPTDLMHPAALDSDLVMLVSDAERAARRARRTPRVVAGGVALGLALGGATAAAASIGVFDWEPWAESAPSNTFTLPSGIECELRLGNVIIGDPAAAAAAQDIIDHTDFIAEVDMEAQLAAVQNATVSEDRKYRMALSMGAQFLVMDKLEERGFDLDDIHFGSISGEGHCAGDVE